MNPEVSKKIRILSFLLMAMICLIHGYNLNQGGWLTLPPFWMSFLETFISDGICRSAVPLFFAVSGFLATKSVPEKFSFIWYLQLLRKKVKTLLIPYLIVSLLGIVLVVGLQLIPFTESFFVSYSLKNLSISDWITIFLISPVPYPIWFIRFLFIYFTIFPIIYLSTKYLKLVYILFALYLWVSFAMQSKLHISKMEAEGLFFFSLGLFIGIEKIDLTIKAIKSYWIVLFAGWLIWIAFRSQNLILHPFDHAANHYHLIGFTLLGVVVLWAGYDFLPKSFALQKWIAEGSAYTIGIFLFHEPVLTICKKLTIRFLGGHDWSFFISYFLSPMLAFLIALVFSKMLSEKFPAVYSISTGNRSPEKSQ